MFFFRRSIIEIISDIQEEVVDPFAFENNDLPAKKAKTSSSNRSSPEAADAPETQSTTSVDETPTTDSQETLTQLRCLRVCKLMLENSFEVTNICIVTVNTMLLILRFLVFV